MLLYTILSKKLIYNKENMTTGEIIFINSVLTEEFLKNLRDIILGIHIINIIKIPTLIYAVYHLIVKNTNENDDADKVITLLKFIIDTIMEQRCLNDDEYTEHEINELIESSILLLKTNFMITKEKKCWLF